jgi:hypothetical protein
MSIILRLFQVGNGLKPQGGRDSSIDSVNRSLARHVIDVVEIHRGKGVRIECWETAAPSISYLATILRPFATDKRNPQAAWREADSFYYRDLLASVSTAAYV